MAELKYVHITVIHAPDSNPLGRALLPEIVKFAYTPRIELRIHGDQQSGSSRRERSPDFSAFRSAGASSSRVHDVDEDEHVLVLDFVDNSRGTKPMNPGFAYALPPALTPAATKKLVERRNERFVEAVNECVTRHWSRTRRLRFHYRLLKATPDGEDPVTLLQAAARDHIPVHPGSKQPSASQADAKEKYREVPDSDKRPSIEEVVCEIEQQDWYREQIVHKRIFEAKVGQPGMRPLP